VTDPFANCCTRLPRLVREESSQTLQYGKGNDRDIGIYDGSCNELYLQSVSETG
jgi:hypothetical protein